MACRSAPADIPVRAALGTVRAVPRLAGMPPDDLCPRSVMAMRHALGYLAARGFASLSPSCFGDDRSSGRSGEFEFAVYLSTPVPRGSQYHQRRRRSSVTDPDDLQQLSVVSDAIIGRAIFVVLCALVRVEHDGPHSHLTRTVDVAEHVVADVDGLRGRDPESLQRIFEQSRVRFTETMVTGNDDGVEIICQPYLVQFATGVGSLSIGDDRQGNPLPQLFEYLPHMWIQFQFLARHPAVDLCQRQR